MVGADQNLNDLRDLTTPFQKCFVILGIGLATINLLTIFEVSISAHYKDITSAHQQMIDSKREPFYDDIAHVIQNAKKLYRLWDSNPRP